MKRIWTWQASVSVRLHRPCRNQLDFTSVPGTTRPPDLDRGAGRFVECSGVPKKLLKPGVEPPQSLFRHCCARDDVHSAGNALDRICSQHAARSQEFNELQSKSVPHPTWLAVPCWNSPQSAPGYPGNPSIQRLPFDPSSSGTFSQ